MSSDKHTTGATTTSKVPIKQHLTPGKQRGNVASGIYQQGGNGNNGNSTNAVVNTIHRMKSTDVLGTRPLTPSGSLTNSNGTIPVSGQSQSQRRTRPISAPSTRRK